MSGDHYLSSEDSALMRRALGGRTGERCLEIGAGNGGTLVHLAKRFALALGTDVVKPAMTDWKGAGANFVLADGASCLRDGTFDLVVFNPPYVKADVEDRAVDGGRSLEVPMRFLDDALRAVKRGGEVVFILNDAADEGEFRAAAARRGFGLRRLVSQRVFFEELTVFSAKADARRDP
jgi:methylase of polypeptide subunit release factors